MSRSPPSLPLTSHPIDGCVRHIHTLSQGTRDHSQELLMQRSPTPLQLKGMPFTRKAKEGISGGKFREQSRGGPRVRRERIAREGEREEATGISVRVCQSLSPASASTAATMQPGFRSNPSLDQHANDPLMIDFRQTHSPSLSLSLNELLLCTLFSSASDRRS